MTSVDKQTVSFELQLRSQHIKVVLVFTNQSMNFRREFNTALSISSSALKATLRPLKNASQLDFIKAKSHLHYLNGLTVGSASYSPKEPNEVENEFYRSLSYPESIQLVNHYNALVIPRMVIRDILSDVEPGLKFYFITRQTDKQQEFVSKYNKLELLRAVDIGNKELDRASLNSKKLVALTLKDYICLKLLGVEEVLQLTGVVYKNGLYCDADCQTSNLKDIAKEYRIEETEMLLKHYFRITESPIFLDKFQDLGGKARLIHEIQFLTEANKYCYFRSVRGDKVFYVRHKSSASLLELLALANIPTEKTKKNLILEAADFAGQNLPKAVEIQLLKHLKAEEIELIDLKNDTLLMVNYTSSKNVNVSVLDLLRRLRKVERVVLPEQVWRVFTQRAYYKSMLSKLGNDMNLICTLSRDRKGNAGDDYLAFRGYGGNPSDVLTHLSKLIHQIQIYSFQIDTRDLQGPKIMELKNKLKDLAPDLKIRDPILTEQKGYLELSGVVLQELHLEQTVAQLKGCMHPLDLDIMEVKEPFDEVELELEDQSFGQTTLHSDIQSDAWSREHSRSGIKPTQSSYQSQIYQEEASNDRSFDISSVAMAQDQSKFHDRTSQSLLQNLPRTVRLPKQLLEGLDMEVLHAELKLTKEDQLWCLQGDSIKIGKGIDTLERLIIESYKLPQPASTNQMFLLRRSELQKQHPRLVFEPIDLKLRQRSKLQWRLGLLEQLREGEVDVYEGFFIDSQPIRKSELASHEQFYHGPIYESFQDQLIQFYKQFTVVHKH